MMRFGKWQRGNWRLALSAMVCGLTIAAWPAAAQQGGVAVPSLTAGETAADDPAAAGEVDDAQVRQLIDTLEDPDRRAELLANLRALLAAQDEQAADEAAPGDPAASLMAAIAARTAVLGTAATDLAEALDQVPRFVAWISEQWREADRRAAWMEAGLQAAVVLAVGIGAYLLLRLVLGPARRSLAARAAGSALGRAVGVPARVLIDLVPVAGLALAAWAAIELIDPSDDARLVIVALVQAVVLVRGGLAVVRRMFASETPELRPFPISDGTARFCLRWSHRLIATSVYGYFLLEAAGGFGLPGPIHLFLLHILFLVVAAMAVVMIFRSREPVGHAVAGLAEGRNRALRWLPWREIAAIWHVVAALYVLFAYLVWALAIPGGLELMLRGTVGTFVVAIGAWLLIRMWDRALAARSAPSEPDTEIETRLRRYAPVLGGLGRGLVLIAVALALLELWGLGVLGWLAGETGQSVLASVVAIVVVAVITLALWELISWWIERSVSEKDADGNLLLSSRTRTLLNITRHFVLVFLSMIAVFLILAELGVNIAPLLAGAGVIGLAIGFGSQKLVQDIITGMFVLFGDTIRVGDVVDLGGRAGLVEAVTIRTVVLRDYNGRVHTIPYSAIDTVTNLTKDFSYAVFDVGVAYREDVDQVMQVLHAIGDEMRADPYFGRLLLEPLEVAGVDRFADSAVVIKARFKTLPIRQWEVSREFHRRVKNRFDELGIEIPFPHQTVYFGVDKEGRAPPARVAFDQPEPGGETAGEPEAARSKPYLAQSGGG